jgi:replicative DNA helicase
MTAEVVPMDASATRLVDGVAFVLDAGREVPAIWGKADDVAWASGEATILVGPDGVGKTTVAQRVMLASLEIGDRVLGLPVEPADTGVLYVSADRPRQAARSLARMVDLLDKRAAGRLREGLRVWWGSLPFDLRKQPQELADWASRLGASHLFLDSLGAIVSRLSDDETGSAVQQAFAYASAAGVEVFATHHNRKAQGDNKKPTAISDVYGSRFITAGCGSVLSLWGSAGDPLVEFRQLKSPAGDVGPFDVELDQVHGDVRVMEGTDLLGQLRAARDGLSAKQAGALLDGANEKSREVKARRRLEELARRGLAVRREGAVIRGSIHEPDRYFAAAREGLQETLG